MAPTPRDPPQIARRAIEPSTVKESKDVIGAISTQKARRNPEYARSIVSAYVELKRAKGRSARKIDTKLLIIESQMPCASLADVFISVREDYNLPPSEVIEYLEQRRQERENKYWEVHGPPPMYGDGDEPPSYGVAAVADA
ncbi:uncharacterized protein LOC62_05G007646 [Vanrija pseudolonga]|uniref:Uncharacterized protein n=1 Tax=Vanrija pseudolonga TaxID=143232 RepID=A0AAF0YCC8_9TREE|nr:hypothetical protein LOC62_05G007646 [Vanrija pseudolonga]